MCVMLVYLVLCWTSFVNIHDVSGVPSAGDYHHTDRILLFLISLFEITFVTNLVTFFYSVVFSPQANYTDREIDRRLLAKLVPTFADRGCRVVSATDPSGRSLT
jgi:hypothetical protein